MAKRKATKKKKPSKKSTKKKLKVNKKTKKINKIDIDQIILHARQILLYGEINENMAYKIIRQLLTLDKISNKPITLMINSGGGSVCDGFAIIDTIKGIRSPVVTIITGKACSMAGLISIVGEEKLMTENSVWMAHDVATANYDYVTKYLARADNAKEVQRRVFAFLAKYTKLSSSDLEKARHEELWLYPKDCKKKGIVNYIIE